MNDKNNVLCPCGSWFYRKPGTRTKYHSEQCARIGQSMIAGRKRREEREKRKLAERR